MDEELKPCPFCGGEPNKFQLSGIEGTFVYCSDPNCAGWNGLSTVAQWNTRPAEDALRQRGNRLVEAVENYVKARDSSAAPRLFYFSRLEQAVKEMDDAAAAWKQEEPPEVE